MESDGAVKDNEEGGERARLALPIQHPASSRPGMYQTGRALLFVKPNVLTFQTTQQIGEEYYMPHITFLLFF